MATNILDIFKKVAAVITIIAGGFLWHLGGSGQKWARSFALPCLLAAVKFGLTFNWWVFLYAPILMALLAIFSYGVGSHVHQFWVSIFKQGGDGNYKPVEWATRMTCGFFWSLAGLVFVFTGGVWWHQIIYTLFLTVANGFFGTQNNVVVSEVGCGLSTSCSILI